MSRIAAALGSVFGKLRLPGKRVLALIAVAALVAAGVGIGLAATGGKSTSSSGKTVIYSTVKTRDLSNTTVISGTLGHKDLTTVEAQSPGFVSAVYAKANTIANAGDALFSLGGRDAIAVDGSLPFFRSLGPGDIGADVLELKQILKAAGDNPGSMDDVFTQQTQAALAAWQDQHHYPSATPASSEAVTVGLQQGVGYQVGAQSTAGMIIGPPGGGTAAGPQTAGTSSATAAAQASGHLEHAPPTEASGHLEHAPPTEASGHLEHAPPTEALGHLERSTPAKASSRLEHSAVSKAASHASRRHTSSKSLTPHACAAPGVSISGSTSVTAGSSVTLTVASNGTGTGSWFCSTTDVYLSIAGSATAGVDYQEINPVLVFQSDEEAQTLTINTLVDSTIATSRYIDVTVSAVANGSYTVGNPATAVVTINPPTGSATVPTLTLTSSTTYLTKGTPYTLLIGLSQAVSTQLTVDLSYSGTAVAGTDYTVPPGDIVVPPGETQIEVQIPTVSNNLVESDRSLTVSLASNSSYTIGSPSSATVTIHDPNVPQMSISGAVSIQPGQSATLTVTASQAPVHDTQIALSLAGSALAGTDYDPPNPVVVIPAGSTTASVTIQTLTTQTIEPSRYIVVSIAQSAAGAYTVQSPGSAVITIVGATASTAPPIVTLSSPITYLHKGSPYQVVFGLSQAIATPITVNLVYSGSAIPGTDFNPPAGSITIPPGQTSFEVTIPTISDNVVESDRTLVVGLAPSLEYQVGVPNEVSVTITSLVVPTITVSTSTQSITEGGDATITFTADQAAAKDTSINFSVMGTAQPGQDYVPLAGTVILPKGQTSVTVTFQSIQKDVVFEPTDMIVEKWPVRIGQIYVKQGNAVTAGEPLIDLTVPQEAVTLQASPSDFTQLAVGQSCSMTISGGQSTLNGVITELDSNPTTLSGSGGNGGSQVFEGQIEVSGGLSKSDQNADGATVSITVTTQEVKNALSVPIAAVLQGGGGSDVVRVVDFKHGGTIHQVDVTTGLTAGSYVQIKGGLRAGQVVLVSINQNQS